MPKRLKKKVNHVAAIQSDFVSLTSHQLRTPLSGMKWMLELLSKDKTKNLNRKQKQYLEKIYYENEKMIALVNDLLEVSRLEAKNTKLYLQTTDIVSIINMVLREKSREIKKRGIHISFHIDPEPFPYLITDPIRAKQAFGNILQNSINYSKSGSKINVSLYIRNNRATIEVCDTGVGILKKEQRRVFSKFFRGSNSLQFESTGTGLGLYITKSFIQASGGKIWFKSKENHGTTFYFTLPIAK